MKYLAISMAVLILASISLSGAAGAGDVARPTLVEISPPLPPTRPGVLSTVGYSPTEMEKPFLARVNEEVPESFHSMETAEYSLAAAEGKYVGWFGIVREISRGTEAGVTRLLIEHKYFDGLIDSHLQVVSFFGAGDFIARLEGDGASIPLLGLVAVYGVMKTDGDGMPRVTADYIRVWDWGRFTFMAYGVDKSNPRWVALRRVAGKNVYRSHPTRKFYEERLGPRAVPGTTPPDGAGPGRAPACPAAVSSPE